MINWGLNWAYKFKTQLRKFTVPVLREKHLGSSLSPKCEREGRGLIKYGSFALLLIPFSVPKTVQFSGRH